MAVKHVTTRMVLETLANDRFTGRTTVLAELTRLSGQPEKVIFRALEREDNRGHLEFGTWLWGAWLTDKGRAELARLRDLDRGGRQTAHVVKCEPQPIADQWMLRCSCGWSITVSAYEYHDLAAEVRKRKDAHEATWT